MPNALDMSSIGPDLEMGSLRALILKPFWTYVTVDCSVSAGVGYGSFKGPLKDMAAIFGFE